MFSSRVLIALGLVWVSAAQTTNAYQCICDSDRIKGFWADKPDGGKCNNCDFDYDAWIPDGGVTVDFLDKANPAECDEIEFCTDPRRDSIEAQCYGVVGARCWRADEADDADFKSKSTKSTPCDCPLWTFGPDLGTPRYAGLFCEKCFGDKTGWPDCATHMCKDVVPEGGALCSNHGTCSDAMATKSCGRTAYTPATQKCLRTKDTESGNSVFRVVLKGEGLAGADQEICGVRSGGIVVCAWYEECSADATSTSKLSDDQAKFAALSPVCHPVGHSPCHTIEGRTTNICTPSQTCCDGACCSSTQACVYEKSSSVVFVPPLYQPVTIYKSMKWVLPDGADGAQYMSKKCNGEAHMSAPAAVRIVVMPIFLALAVLASFGLIMTADGECGGAIKVPAMLLVLCALLLCFSGYWPLGLLVTLSGCVAIGAAKKGDSYVIAVALLFQFFALAVVCGGLGVGVFFVDATSGMNVADISDSSQTNWVVLEGCSNYFGYFQYNSNAAFKPANVDDREYFGYCSLGWHTVLFIVQALMVFSQVVMIVASGVAFIGK